jgi:hypothetical protein
MLAAGCIGDVGGRPRRWAACVENQHVHLLQNIAQTVDGGWIGEVANACRDFPFGCGRGGCERAQSLQIARDGDDVCAFARKTQRDCPTQPAGGARHQRAAIFKS